MMFRQTRENETLALTLEELSEAVGYPIEDEDTSATVTIRGALRDSTRRVLAQKAVVLWIK